MFVIVENINFSIENRCSEYITISDKYKIIDIETNKLYCMDLRTTGKDCIYNNMYMFRTTHIFDRALIKSKGVICFYNKKGRLSKTMLMYRLKLNSSYSTSEKEKVLRNIADQSVKLYYLMFPKWVHLYKYFVITNQLGNTDIFSNIFAYYFFTITYMI